MIDLATYTPKGDKENSAFFDEYLPRIYERRAASGIDDIVGTMAGVLIQVEHGDAVPYLAELAVMGPYRLIDTRLTETHKLFLLQSDPTFPRLLVIEPLSGTYEDKSTRFNLLYPLAAKKPNARYVGEIYRSQDNAALRDALEPQAIRFVYEGDTVSPIYRTDHLTFTFLSDYTYNRVGYVDTDIDDLDALGFGERFSLTAAEQEMLDKAAQLQADHGITDRVTLVDEFISLML